MSSPAPRDIDPVPTLSARVDIHVVEALPPASDAAALAVPVIEGDRPPADLGTDWSQLNAVGFTAAPGQAAVLPGPDGRALVALGVGDASTVDATRVRDLAADVRARGAAAPDAGRRAGRRGARPVPRRVRPGRRRGGAARTLALLRGRRGRRADARLAHHRRRVGAGGRGPRRRRARPGDGPGRGDQPRPRPTAPPAPSRPSGWARSPSRSAPLADLEVELFDRRQLHEMGCGGILGVNRGSVEEPRLIRIRYRPDVTPRGHLGAGRQGDHVRLGRHQPQAERRVPRADEERHDRARPRSSVP